MKTIPAKKLVTTTNGFNWFGAKYNLNIYRGCNFGCIYCDSRSDCYQVNDFDEVKLKEDIEGKLEKELSTKRKTGIVGMGSMSDPYNSFEKKEEATRKALKIINKYKFGVNITTKSDLILRDIDILKKINQHSRVVISVTITTLDDDLAKKIEPGSPTTSRRFEVLKQLSDAGIYCGITFMPLIPFINDDLDNVLGIVEYGFRAGVNYIYPGFGVTQRDGQREFMYEHFDKLFPGLKEKFIKEFNYKYHAYRENGIYEIFQKRCTELEIKTKMADIVEGAKEYVKEQQLCLF